MRASRVVRFGAKLRRLGVGERLRLEKTRATLLGQRGDVALRRRERLGRRAKTPEGVGGGDGFDSRRLTRFFAARRRRRQRAARQPQRATRGGRQLRRRRRGRGRRFDPRRGTSVVSRRFFARVFRRALDHLDGAIEFGVESRPRASQRLRLPLAFHARRRRDEHAHEIFVSELYLRVPRGDGGGGAAKAIPERVGDGVVHRRLSEEVEQQRRLHGRRRGTARERLHQTFQRAGSNQDVAESKRVRVRVREKIVVVRLAVGFEPGRGGRRRRGFGVGGGEDEAGGISRVGGVDAQVDAAGGVLVGARARGVAALVRGEGERVPVAVGVRVGVRRRPRCCRGEGIGGGRRGQRRRGGRGRRGGGGSRGVVLLRPEHGEPAAEHGGALGGGALARRALDARHLRGWGGGVGRQRPRLGRTVSLA